MADELAFAYVVLRAVPSVERGERLNVGVVLFCRQAGFLGARVSAARLEAFEPFRLEAEVAAGVGEVLDALVSVARGKHGSGAVGKLAPSERFGWLAAPSSTIVQPSEVHTGLCVDPEATLDGLFARLVG